MDTSVLVETSARHVHLSEKDLATLFGQGHQLTNIKDLSQPGQFACEERVTVVGPKRSLERVSVLGPTRKDTQVELSLTDARSIGIKAPVRESGDVVDSAPCKLVGPCGEVELTEGVIIAKRHIHATPEDAQRLNLQDKEVVLVKVCSGERSLQFDDVVVRVSPTYAWAMHIDTDESNAAGVVPGQTGEVLKK